MIDKTEQLLRRMRWKAFHFLNPELTTVKENFGFKTRNCPPVIEEMKKFEDGMISIIQNINFQDVKCQFQQDLKEDIKSVKNDKHLFVKADKSINFYKLDTSKYNQLLNDNVTKIYKKTDKKQLNKIDAAAKKIAMKLNIDDRVEITATKEAFITLKDHKDNFENRPTCRLINPSKLERGPVSKQILEKINRQLVDITKVNQWKNTASMLQWYKQITNKRDSSFICFDVVEFYPSISEVLLNRALDFAFKYVTISADDRQIIIHAKRSLLFNNGDQWGKKTSNMLFDITMGSYDGAETCELVGCYLLSKLKQIFGNDIGLYRDDGLAILNKIPKEIEKMKKEICKVFADNDLRITIEANKKVVNFLDVTLDLNTEKYKPYAKPTNIPLYVHSKSNHPPNIIKNIPESINRRLSDISSDEDVFNEAAPVYQEALRKSGYTHKLEYKPKTPTPTPKRNRHRNVIWFNPPFSKNVKSNIGKEFINLIDRCFPAGHKLKKIFNRNTLKISYSCMPSVKQIIDGHNKATLKKDAQPQHDETKNTCNCRKKDECPLEGECLTKEIIYQATIKTKDTTETYVGLTATEFKTRWRNHQMSFKHEKRKNDTELSKYLWKLKGKQEEYTLKWRILAKAKAYTNL
ncbi:MAG: hypothetical protein DSY43_05320, partial [Gammaproteobacteria bacterium]